MTDTIRLAVSRQSPAERAWCLDATKIKPHRLERWLADPRGEPLTDDQIDALDGWIKGQYGKCSTSEGWVRRKPTPKATALPKRHVPFISNGKVFEMGVAAGGQKRIPAKNKMKDLPKNRAEAIAWNNKKKSEEPAVKREKETKILTRWF